MEISAWNLELNAICLGTLDIWGLSTDMYGGFKYSTRNSLDAFVSTKYSRSRGTRLPMVFNAGNYSVVGVRSSHHDISVDELGFRTPDILFSEMEVNLTLSAST